MIAQINANNKSFPVKFGMAALSEFLDAENLQLGELDKIASNLTLTRALRLVHLGMKHGARVAGERFELSFEDVCDLMDENPGLMQEVLDIFGKQMTAFAGNGQVPEKTPAKERK